MLIFTLIISVFSKAIYDVKKSYVTPISEINFEKQINKIRQTTKFVTIVHFYRFAGIIFVLTQNRWGKQIICTIV